MCLICVLFGMVASLSCMVLYSGMDVSLLESKQRVLLKYAEFTAGYCVTVLLFSQSFVFEDHINAV